MGGMNENGQPPMAAMAELLKCTSRGCKATVSIRYALLLVAISTDALVMWKI